MLDALAVPPRLILRALDDLHTVARHMPALTGAAEVLPRTEDELSASIERLRGDVQGLRADIESLRTDVGGAEQALGRLETLLKKLPGI